MSEEIKIDGIPIQDYGTPNSKSYYSENIIKMLKSYEKLFEFSPNRYGRMYYTFYRAIDIALESKKVSVILTKNKNNFKSIILEFIKNNRDYRMEEYEKYYDIIKNDKLLVKIAEVIE